MESFSAGKPMSARREPAHLDHVGDLLEAALGISDLLRLEVHGSAAELDQMREPLKDLPVEWFVLECGLQK